MAKQNHLGVLMINYFQMVGDSVYFTAVIEIIFFFLNTDRCSYPSLRESLSVGQGHSLSVKARQCGRG